MKNATFRQLRVFSAVARHLSFAKAAQVLHVSAPAISMQIKELETAVGMPLFDRQGRKVSLTTGGEYMLVYARKMLATLKDAEDAAARLQKLEVALLTIGMVSVLGIVLGSFVSAKHQGSFRWEGFSNIADLKRHLLGGCLMGVGAVMAIGCSIGQGLSGVSTLNILSILATAAIVMGAFIALQYDLKRAD
mgnify:CR=1 FL=1